MLRLNRFALVGLVAGAVACGGGGGAPKPMDPSQKSGKKDRSGRAVSKKAARGFELALDEFMKVDEKQSWRDATCKKVAGKFAAASKEQESASGRPLPEAVYNAALAHQRCGQTTEALALFEAALKAEPKFHRARAQLALYEYEKSKNLDKTIADLEQIIRDAKFQNVEALVSVAALQMERGGDQKTRDGANDLARAKLNLQRALAIDDGYMPAFNQLSIYYLELARAAAEKGKRRGKKKRRSMVVAGAAKSHINEQQLDLAALVASQAIRKNPNYAPIHNTSGLIQVELKNYNGAVKAFGKAKGLDPKFFEALMNYAAVNLSFRGFKEAENAYRDALKLRPKEYEAHLGLALAIRGQINDANFDKYVAEAEKHLEIAKKIEPKRAETYYNEAILTQEYKAKGEPAKAVPALKAAVKQYNSFISKAGADPVFEEAVKRSKERVQDIGDMVKFIEEGQKAAAAAPPPPPTNK